MRRAPVETLPGADVATVTTFAVVLLLAVLFSDLAERTVLSTAVLFLVAGILAGPEVLGFVPVNQPLVGLLAQLALFTVLFTDGMKVRFRTLRSAWLLPTRALVIGMPLTIGVTAVLAHFLTRLGWTESFVVGTVLSPTDPVFASAIVGREGVPFRLRHLLNIESGLNDGLALPVMVILLNLLRGQPAGVVHVIGELAAGLVLGAAVAWILCLIERLRFLGVAPSHRPLFAFTAGLLVYCLSSWMGVNEYLASFAAGITLGNLDPQVGGGGPSFGEQLTELLKLGALLVFGALISPGFLASIDPAGYGFAVVTLLVARPAGLVIALYGSSLSGRERLAAMWFGPRGFASVVYGILVLESRVAFGQLMFHLIAATVALSIVADSSTDVLVARWLQPTRPDGGETEPNTDRGPSPPDGDERP